MMTFTQCGNHLGLNFKINYQPDKKISNELTVPLGWKTKELCMIDNLRFMYGRKRIIKN